MINDVAMDEWITSWITIIPRQPRQQTHSYIWTISSWSIAYYKAQITTYTILWYTKHVRSTGIIYKNILISKEYMLTSVVRFRIDYRGKTKDTKKSKWLTLITPRIL